MAGIDIRLNSQNYVLAPREDGSKISSRPTRQFVQAIKDTGRTRPDDVAGFETFIHPNFSYGFGRYRINSDAAFNPTEYRKFWDSTAETRWPDATYLPMLSEDATQSGLEVVRASAQLGAEFNALWDDGGRVVNRQFTGASTDAWENGASVNPVIFNTHVADGVSIGAGGTRTISFSTAGAGSALLVFFAVTNPTSPGTGMITMTYNSVSLSMGTNGNTNLHTYYMMSDAPAAGENNLVLTNTDGSNAVQDGIIVIVNILTTSTGNFFGSSNPATEGDENDNSITLTGTTSGRLVVGATFTDQGGLMAPGSGVTEHATFEDSEGSGKNSIIFGSIQATGSSTTFSATAAGSGHEQTVAIEMTSSGSAQLSPSVGLDMITHKGKLIALTAEEDDHRIYYSDDGVAWTRATTDVTAGLLADNVTANEDIDAGLLVNYGQELVAVVWDEDSGAITFFSSTNNGATFADETTQIPSVGGPHGVAVYPDTDGTTKIYVSTYEGIYAVDGTVSTWTYDLIVPMTPHTNNGRRMTIHDGSLWFAQGVDADTPAPIYRMTVRGGTRDVDSGFGLNAGDGVPKELLGSVNWMKSAGDFLFISVGGHDGADDRFSRILAWNGLGWHSMTEHGTADKPIEWIDVGAGDDATPRLHYGVRTSSSASDARFLEQPLVNPRSGVSIKREDDSAGVVGYIDLPYIDLGMPHESKNFLRAHVNAESLNSSASDEYISIQYGKDDAARTTTALGNFTSATTANTLASNAGVSAKNIGLRVNLLRGSTNTNTPKLKDIIVEGMVVPGNGNLTYQHEMIIDIDQTAMALDVGTETIYDNLKTLLATVTLVDFEFGGESRKVAVDREASGFLTYLDGDAYSSAPNSLAARRGVLRLVLAERIPLS
tara:strand:+ start:11480 stop:14134 length:2655 start_codon:yes stop_codon:yes gene_type:complete